MGFGQGARGTAAQSEGRAVTSQPQLEPQAPCCAAPQVQRAARQGNPASPARSCPTTPRRGGHAPPPAPARCPRAPPACAGTSACWRPTPAERWVVGSSRVSTGRPHAQQQAGQAGVRTCRAGSSRVALCSTFAAAPASLHLPACCGSPAQPTACPRHAPVSCCRRCPKTQLSRWPLGRAQRRCGPPAWPGSGACARPTRAPAGAARGRQGSR